MKNAGGKIEITEEITQLLAAMPESYQTVVMAIDVLFYQEDANVTLVFVKNKLLIEEDRQKKSEAQKEDTVSQHAFLGQRCKKPFNRNKYSKGDEEKPSRNYTFNGKCFICGGKGRKKIDFRKAKEQINVAEKQEKKEEENITFVTQVKMNRDGEKEDRGYTSLFLNTQEVRVKKL